MSNNFQQKKQISVSSQIYKVFIAGIPSTLTYKAVLDFFSKITPVAGVESIDTGLAKYPPKSHQTAIQGNKRFQLKDMCTKGCCILLIETRQAYESILHKKKILLFGRSLIVKKYMTDKELYEHNRNVNMNRVLLKRVPVSLNREQIKQHLESYYGSVEIIYPFKTQSLDAFHDKSENYRGKMFNTYSVTFKKKESAASIVNMGEICIEGCEGVIVQRYEHDKKSENIFKSTTSLINTINIKKPLQVEQHRHKSRKEELKVMVQSLETGFSLKCLIPKGGDDSLVKIHSTKPTMKGYFKHIFSEKRCLDGRAILLDHNAPNIRVNIHSDSYETPLLTSVEN